MIAYLITEELKVIAIMETDKIAGALVFEYLKRIEKNAAALFEMNCGPVCILYYAKFALQK